MFRETQDSQMNLNDRMLSASRQALNAIDKSRAKIIGDVIYPEIDESKFAALFSSIGSRPNIPIRRYVCFLMLEKSYGIPEAEMLELLRCGALNFQYAIHTTQDDEQPLSESSLRRFRRSLEAYNKGHGCDLLKDEFERISRKMAINMGLLHDMGSHSEEESVLIRMDSMEIESHARHMPRHEIIYMTNVIVIRYLLRKDFAEVIPPELAHYLKEGDHNDFVYYKAPAGSGTQEVRVVRAIEEMILLQESMLKYFSEELLKGIPEYQTLERVLNEQTVLDSEGRRSPRDKRSIAADSVQNPFDTTVTYRNKRGPHYGSVLNVAEVVDGKGNGIVVSAQMHQNTMDDAKMAEEYVSGLPDGGPRLTITADGAYDGDSLEEAAMQKNVEIINSALSGKAPNEMLADFVFDEDGKEVITCPAGKQPTSCQYNDRTGMVTARMPDNCCAGCPFRSQCNAKVNNKKQRSTVRVSRKMAKRAKKLSSLGTKYVKRLSHVRNGSEGIMSVLRRKYRIDEIPQFGIERAKPVVWLSLLAYNVGKYQRYMDSPKKPAVAL